MSTLNCAARSAAKILQYSTAYATLTKHILINHSHSHHTEPLSGPSVFDLSVCGRPQFQLYVPPLHLYTCGLTCTPQLHSTVCSSACRRSIGSWSQCGARSTSDLQLGLSGGSGSLLLRSAADYFNGEPPRRPPPVQYSERMHAQPRDPPTVTVGCRRTGERMCRAVVEGAHAHTRRDHQASRRRWTRTIAISVLIAISSRGGDR